MKRILALIIIGFACSLSAADVTVRLSAEQEAAVNSVVNAENVRIAAYNADTNNVVKLPLVTASDVLARYATRLVAIQGQNRTSSVAAKFAKAVEADKVKIEAEIAKIPDAVEVPKEP